MSRRRHAGLLVGLAIALSFARASFADFIARRGDAPGLAGTVTLIDDGGIAIRTDSGAEHVVTWDRVREVTSNDPSVQRKVSEHRDTATALWRARTRLERGDAGLAEPLFERLFAQFKGRSHETALIVAEGLLRCRLARSANDAAIIPALEAMRLRRKGVKSSSYGGLARIFDDATSLCMRLPPAWVSSSALARVEVELKSYDAGGDTAVAAIAALYRSAARTQLNLAAEESAVLAQDQPGVMLMRSMVNCGDATPEKRAAARTALETRMRELPSWAQAWARYAIGQSLLRETGAGRQEQGLVSLAHLPASFSREQPYLSALALATLCMQLQRSGATDEAAALRNELTRDYPNHPALTLLDSAAMIAPDIEAGAQATSRDHDRTDAFKDTA